MLKTFDFFSCEKVIGYTFKNKELLFQCFCHSSYTNEHKNLKDNERLEFFGDSILGFIVTEYLYGKFQQNEGNLTTLKQKIVSKKPLSKATIDNGFDRFVLLGEGEKRLFSQNRENICENLFEAIVASIYLDGGLEEAKKFVFDKLINNINVENFKISVKNSLQEYVQKNKLGEIEYKDISSEGPAHKPIFTVALFINDILYAQENGSSKQEAQKKCAKIALSKLKKEGEN